MNGIVRSNRENSYSETESLSASRAFHESMDFRSIDPGSIFKEYGLGPDGDLVEMADVDPGVRGFDPHDGLASVNAAMMVSVNFVRGHGLSRRSLLGGRSLVI